MENVTNLIILIRVSNRGSYYNSNCSYFNNEKSSKKNV